MKKKALILLLVLVVACTSLLALAACNKDDGKTHIVFYHTMGANLREVLDKYIAKFEAMYPDYKIDSKQVGSYDDVRNQISSEIMVGNQPHVAYCYPDHIALYNLTGAVQTLDDFIASTDTVTKADGTTETIGLTQTQKDDFIKGYYEEGAQFGDGKMYSLPFSKSTEVLYYNKTFFDKEKLEVPTHWWCTESCPAGCKSSMEYVCKTIKSKYKKLIPLGYDSEANWFITMCEQLDTPYTSAEATTKEGHFLFNTAENRAFVEKFSDWHSKGYVTTQKINSGYTSDLFTAQQSVMCVGSSAGASHQIPENRAFESGIASIPQANPSSPKVISQGPSVCIFKKANAEEVKMSWLFVKYLTTSPEFQAEFSVKSGYIPVIKSAANQEAYKKSIEKANGYENLPQLSTVVGMAQEEAYYASPAFYGSSKARDIVGSLMQTCFTSSVGKSEAQIKDIVAKAFEKAVKDCVQSL